MIKDSDYWISKLGLTEHIEGGYFREIFRSSELISADALPSRYDKDHNFVTSIYYLVKSGAYSKLHRLRSDELWHFYSGSPFLIKIINEEGIYSELKLGSDPENGESLFGVVPAGSCFGGFPLESDSFSLLGATVAPGFLLQDFELPDIDELIEFFPQHEKIIKELS